MKSFTLKEKVWVYKSEKAAWHFVTLNKEMSAKLKALKKRRVGWGSLRVEVKIGKTKFKTSLFPNKKLGYMLPIKKSVREAEGVESGDKVEVKLTLI